MKYQEMLDISTNSVHKDRAESFLPILKHEGYQFEIVRDGLIRTFVEHQDYSPETYNDISRIIKAHNWDVEFSRQIRTKYEEHDYNNAVYINPVIESIWIDEADAASVRTECKTCGMTSWQHDYSIVVPHVKSRRAIAMLNFCGPLIISEDAVDVCLRANLTGLDVIPFDEEERYYYLVPETNAGYPVGNSKEVLDYSGICEDCGSLMFGMWYGPFRLDDTFPHKDFVNMHFRGPKVLFSKKAYELLHKLECSYEVGDLGKLAFINNK